MKYTLLEVLTEPYNEEDAEYNFFTLMGKFFIPSKNKEVIKRIAVVNFDNCRIIYDSISCPKEAFEPNNQKEILSKAVETLLGYYYGQSKSIIDKLLSVGNEVDGLCNMSVEYSKSSIFDAETKKKLTRRVDSIKNSLNNADEYYKQIHEYIVLYVYTTIFKTLCKNNVELFTSAINGTYEELADRYNFTSGIGLSFSIMKDK